MKSWDMSPPQAGTPCLGWGRPALNVSARSVPFSGRRFHPLLLILYSIFSVALSGPAGRIFFFPPAPRGFAAVEGTTASSAFFVGYARALSVLASFYRRVYNLKYCKDTRGFFENRNFAGKPAVFVPRR